MSTRKRKRHSPKSGDGNPFVQEQEQDPEQEIKIKYSQVCKLGKILLVATVFLLCNIGIGWLIKLMT